jgi:hypothetical protein
MDAIVETCISLLVPNSLTGIPVFYLFLECSAVTFTFVTLSWLSPEPKDVFSIDISSSYLTGNVGTFVPVDNLQQTVFYIVYEPLHILEFHSRVNITCMY